MLFSDMDIRLIISDNAEGPNRFRHYSPDLDSVVSILSDIVDGLDGQCSLIVSGFGDERWKTEPVLDTLLVLEQLPDIFTALSAHHDFTVDFYEQHLQRFIEFRADDSGYMATMHSRLEARAFPQERIGQNQLLAVFEMLRDTFVGFCESRQLSVVSHPWYQEWLKNTESKASG